MPFNKADCLNIASNHGRINTGEKTVRSYPIQDAKKLYVLLTPRGSFARGPWADAWTRSVDEAYILVGETDAKRAAKHLNERLGKDAVTPSCIADHMIRAWGFNVRSGGIECIEKYFDPTVLIETEPPAEVDHRYSQSLGKAYKDPKLAWEHLRSHRMAEIKWHRAEMEALQKDLDLCNSELGIKDSKNVVAIQRNADEQRETE